MLYPDLARGLLVTSIRHLLGCGEPHEPYLGRFTVRLETRRRELSETFPAVCCCPPLPEARRLTGDWSHTLQFSANEELILDALRKRPLPAKLLPEATGLSETHCKILAANLKARRAIETTEDGYRISQAAE